MAFWSGEEIERRGSSLIEEFDDSQLDTNAYELRMGDSYFLSGSSRTPTRKLLKDGESFSIPSGQFAFLLSKEKIFIPKNSMAFISIRTSKKFAGLINVSGFHIDPGYEGKLIYAVFNAGPVPVHISKDERIFKIWFAELTEEPKGTSYYYKGNPKNYIDSKTIGGMSKELLSLDTLDLKVDKFNSELQDVKSELNACKSLLSGLFVAVIVGISIAVLSTLLGN